MENFGKEFVKVSLEGASFVFPLFRTCHVVLYGFTYQGKRALVSYRKGTLGEISPREGKRSEATELRAR